MENLVEKWESALCYNWGFFVGFYFRSFGRINIYLNNIKGQMQVVEFIMDTSSKDPLHKSRKKNKIKVRNIQHLSIYL